MKRANGTGSIYKMKDRKRRKPWRVRVTDNWVFDKEQNIFRQKTINIGYFETRREAEAALLQYLDGPYDVKNRNMTFEEVYKEWYDEYTRKKCKESSSQRTVEAAYKYCSGLYKMRIRDVRPYHMKECMEQGFVIIDRGKDKGEKRFVSPSTKKRMKSIFNLMFDWANERDLVEKNYARLFEVDSEVNEEYERNKRENVPFTQDEIKKLWENVNKIPFADMVLIGIFSGWRPQELAILKVKDIDLENQLMVGGLKTDAGKNRTVPIHPLIADLVKNRYEEAMEIGSKYLFNDPDGQQGTYMTYDKYRRRFEKVMGRLDMSYHHAHETRHTFVTKAKKAKMDEYLLKRIVGHSIKDLTEDTYTHREFEELREAIKLITE